MSLRVNGPNTANKHIESCVVSVEISNWRIVFIDYEAVGSGLEKMLLRYAV